MEQSRLDSIAVALGEGALSGTAPSILERLLRVSSELFSVTGAGIAIIDKGQHRGAVAVSDATFAAVDDLQFSLGEGPGIDAAATGRPILEPDLSQSLELWPAFVPAAIALGTQAVFAFPLRIGAVNLGVLTLCRDAPGDLDATDLADAVTLGHIATHLLLELEAGAAPGSFPDHLADVLEHRAQVHQATGMIAAQLDVDVATALVRLRAFAWSHDRSIDDVAGDVVRRHTHFGENTW